MKKVFINRLIGLFALLVSLPVLAYDFESGGIYYNIDGDNVSVTISWDYRGDIVIPSQVIYNGKAYNVTSIEENAFNNCNRLTSVVIPNTVTTIGSYAFFACSALTLINIPYGVTYIGDHAFTCCEKISSISIPNSVTYIGVYAFWQCNIKSVYIPSSVSFIGDDVFYQCYNLGSITVDEGNRTYDSRNNCNAIIETATNTLVAGCKNTIIPQGISSLGPGAFAGCRDLRTLKIPKSLTKVRYGFSGCNSLESIVVEEGNTIYDSRNNCNAIIETATNTLVAGCKNTIIPNGVKVIGRWSFENIESLTSVTIPESVTTINWGAFLGCRGVTSLSIPNSVTSIGGAAFQNCKMSSVIIPNSVTFLGEYAFSYCENLTSVTLSKNLKTMEPKVFSGCSGITTVISKMEMPIEIEKSVFPDDVYEKAELIVPKGTKSAYQSTAGWNNFTNIVEASSGEWREVTKNFDKSIAFKKIRVKNAKTSSGTYCCVFFSTKSNDNTTSDTKYNINFNRLTIGDGVEQDDSRGYIYINTCKSIGDNWYEYEFKQPVYFSHYQSNSPTNQLLAYVEETGTNEAVTITAKSYTREYGDANPTFEYTVSGGSINGIPNITCSASKASSVGYYTINIEKGSVTNSNVTYIDGTLTITKAPLTVTANSYSRIEGEDNPIFGVTYSGFKNNETESVLTRKPNITTSATTSSSPGTYDINVSGAEAENYSFNYIKGTLTVIENNNVTYTSGGITYNCEKSSLTAEVISFDQSKSYISIPETIIYSGRTYRVTSIGRFAFYQCRSITSLIIPSSVISIGSSAFEDCTGLTSVTLSEGLTSIGGSSFEGCKGITSIILPSTINSISINAFKNCTNLNAITSEIQQPFAIDGSVFSTYSTATLTVPNGRKNAYQATDGWNKFNKITEVAGVDPTPVDPEPTPVNPDPTPVNPTIGSTFYLGGIYYKIGENNTVSVTSGDAKYSGDVLIPEQVTYSGKTYSVTSIGWSAFDGCGDLISVTIPNSVTSLDWYAFQNCRGLTSIVIPNSVTSIGKYAFSGCSGITSLTISNTLSSISGNAFQLCSSLTSVIIPNSVSIINDEAFYGCTSLTTITIPNSVTYIGDEAFYVCKGLTTIVSEIENPFELYSWVFSDDTYKVAELIVPKGTKALYQSTGAWNKFTKITEAADKDEVAFTIDGISYQGSKSEKNVVVKSVDTGKTWMEIPASASYDGITYQVTGIDNDVFKGNSIAALIWDVEAAIPNNAFSNASIGSNFLLYVKSATYAPSSVKNVVVDGTAQTVALSDNGGPFFCPQTFIARSISYTHNFTMETGGNGKGWESLVLPFFVQKISHSTRGEIVPFALYSSGSSQKPFWLAKFSGNGFKRTSAIEANEPYIIAMPNSKNYRNDYNLAGEVTFSAENAAVPKTPTFDGAFVPAFAPVTKSSSVKALNNASYSGGYDPGSRFIPNLRDIRPFEAYMTGSSTRGIIEINFDDGTTDMLDILFMVDESREVTIHTLSGLQVTRTTQRDFNTVWLQLPKGVYIVNDKKMIK